MSCTFSTWCVSLFLVGAVAVLDGCSGSTPPPPPASAGNSATGVAGAGNEGTSRASSAVLVAGKTLAFGAVDGTTVVTRNSGDVWGFSEDVALMFPAPISPTSYHATVSPTPLSGVEIVVPVRADMPAASAQNLLQIRWSKEPAVTYTVTVRQDGVPGPVATLVVRTNSTIPGPAPPILSKRNDPYYYGSLEHSSVYPYGIKLPQSGSIDPRALSALVGQHVHFIRFGPSPTEVAWNTTGPQSRQNYSFASTDPAIQTLHANNISTLYVIDAASAPPWGNPNTVGDARPLFETPQLYAEYCGGVAAHIATALPWISRVEIGTNEPNMASNWQNGQAVRDGMPQYADATGYGVALYIGACYSAIKAVAPALSVVAPGMVVGNNAYPSFQFLDHMFANGCRTGTCWDILSVHTYTWVNPAWSYDESFMDNLFGPGAGPGTLLSYRALQQRAVLDGDRALPPVMITETGYSSYAYDPDGADPKLQAFYTSEAFNEYLSDPTVKGVVWADIVNHETSPNLFYGISTLDQNNNPKPVWYVFNTFATY